MTLLLWLLLVILSYSFYGLLRYSLFPPQNIQIPEHERRTDLHKGSSQTSSTLDSRRWPGKADAYGRKTYGDLISEATESEIQSDPKTPRDIINASVSEQTTWQKDPATPRELVDNTIVARGRAASAAIQDESSEKESSSEEDQDERFDWQTLEQIGVSSEHLRLRKSYQAAPD